MAHEFDEVFGDLRALINGPKTEHQWALVCDMIEVVYELDPERIIEQWMPYLRQATGRWPRRIKRAPSHWLEHSEALLGIFDVLTLRGDPIGDDGALALAASDHLHSLTYLDISGANITARGLAYICDSGSFTSLEVLGVWDNPLGDDGAEVLAEAHLPRVERLYVRGAGITDDGAMALAVTKSWPRLRTLNLEYNLIGDAGARALVSMGSGVMPSLERLLLRGNLVSARSRETLSMYGRDVVLKV